MTVIPVEKKVLSENQRIAASLRDRFEDHGTLCLNLISSPGSGKTTLLEQTLGGFRPEERVAVLTGDLQTENDAKRLARYGFPVQQITTGGVCHLDGKMIERALERWSLDAIDLLFIENVGNLVCPSSYDLGEEAKIVLLSVTEGEDKPLKYPSIFAKSELLVLTKVDLLPHVPFKMEEARANARLVHPGIEILELSCATGQGLEEWRTCLSRRRETALQRICAARA
ncbi:hydrogenase nickel incorporation protein HypB [Granulicella sp. 5B5]|uniref:hydrogenase nickel incorporation protein HypB n=1 Tax=Granulicella sp. 5B5 TaxID=1617967 RepID=UPI0015F4D27A|nr:hydrogenase nickel incorporation protein HypB [Granulicella sp. 5B5]QMV19891.1 hydrogenase nickel incorporation protein HypB [Granulicella sp. 5B5]